MACLPSAATEAPSPCPETLEPWKQCCPYVPFFPTSAYPDEFSESNHCVIAHLSCSSAHRMSSATGSGLADPLESLEASCAVLMTSAAQMRTSTSPAALPSRRGCRRLARTMTTPSLTRCVRLFDAWMVLHRNCAPNEMREKNAPFETAGEVHTKKEHAYDI